MSIPSNPELELARDFVEYTDRNVFLTGKAGTGKTTFLHNLAKISHKRMIVAAPTGVAAINAGGVTLHSFFQLPFGPCVPGGAVLDRPDRYRFSREKKNIVRSLDLLVIDEISMVRADVLDGVDAVLRYCRRSDLPFGGVQLLMIGDLRQLSPVVKEDEQKILGEFYDSMYFFGCRALSLSDLVVIELKHIYRQSDTSFIELLNRVRENELDEAELRQLNSRYRKNFSPEDHEGYITLTTHNRSADAVNEARLRSLPHRAQNFRAKIEGDFPEYSYPTLPALTLKKGAQVMFVRNDPSAEKLYFNGKIGKITRIAEQSVSVKCPGEEREITAQASTWENIKYGLEPATGEITREKIGSFEQLPLKPAWAITIHKSQGLTFERAVIDAGAAFAHGQVYVALSRCKSFEGLVLSSPIPAQAVKTDSSVSRFIAGTSEDPPTMAKLAAAKILYQRRLLTECFDFSKLRFLLSRFLRTIETNKGSIKVSGAGELGEVQNRAMAELFVVAQKFHRQLSGLFTKDCLPEADPVVLERVSKAGVYFEERLQSILGDLLSDLRIDTDNKELAKITRNGLEELKKETAAKLLAAASCKAGFSCDRYLRALSSAAIELKPDREKKSKPQYSPSELSHPELFQSLKDWRAARAAEAGVPNYHILHQSVLLQIAVGLPQSSADLNCIRGIGKHILEKYGEALLELVSSYRQKHSISEPFRPPAPAAHDSAPAEAKPAAKDTREATRELFSKGLSLEQIAKDRGLARSTIEGHLASLVEAGRIEIARVLSEEKLLRMDRQLAAMPDRPFGEIKQALGENFSYGEIRLALAYRKFLAAAQADEKP